MIDLMQNTFPQNSRKPLKIVVYGPESTGKTTLAKALAEHFGTAWVPEFAREYLQEKYDNAGEVCDYDDLMPIAEGQLELEKEREKSAKNRLLICDTNPLQTYYYGKAYFDKFKHSLLLELAMSQNYDFYFLTGIDVQWTPDDLRDKPDERQLMFDHFRDSLDRYDLPYTILTGSKQKRLDKAIKQIDKLLQEHQNPIEKMNTYTFDQADIRQLEKHGLSQDAVQNQLRTFERGIPFASLDSAATVGKGILELDKTARRHLSERYDSSPRSRVKFVPASGAASRMFKLLHRFSAEFNPKTHTLDSFLESTDFQPLKVFFEHIEKLPFYDNVRAEMKTSIPDYSPSSGDGEKYDFVQFMLDEMDYSSLPKGLIPFHRYADKTVTAFEEHIYEAAKYVSESGRAKLHFTVAEAHLNAFKAAFNDVKSRVEKETGISFSVSYSFQEKSTDTIAVNPDNTPFREENGELLFRPGGHGALIENLNKIDADIVFIKNIDNVVTEAYLPLVAEYKKALAGVLITVQENVFALLNELEHGFTDTLALRAKDLAKRHFGIQGDFSNAEAITGFFKRPIRVCGMVKNEGQPGGGPFWIKEKNGSTSLQIIEAAQIDTADDSQAEILQKATHFNPVDLVCGIRDYTGKKFDLTDFVDSVKGFIAEKSKNGKPLKALELPGLWNGGMARWNTIFVEVPIETFNPVKTVADLLKDAHRVH